MGWLEMFFAVMFSPCEYVKVSSRAVAHAGRSLFTASQKLTVPEIATGLPVADRSSTSIVWRSAVPDPAAIVEHTTICTPTRPCKIFGVTEGIFPHKLEPTGVGSLHESFIVMVMTQQMVVEHPSVGTISRTCQGLTHQNLLPRPNAAFVHQGMVLAESLSSLRISQIL